MDIFKLDGKTALITGASKGIGARCAETLAKAGAKVIITARQEGALKKHANQINSNGGCAIPLRMDVTDKSSVKSSIDGLIQEGHKIDILVNNAGISLLTPIFDKNDPAFSNHDDFEAQMQTNVMGVWNVTKVVANHMKEEKVKGSIINIASVCGANRLRSSLTGYCASKAAVIQMTKALVGELATFDIRINCIAPGLFHTPLNDDRVSIPEVRKEIEKTIPLHFVADPEEIDGAILFLASNKASRYVAGSCLTVDGGASWGGAYDFYTFKGSVY